MIFNHNKSAILLSREKYMKNVCHLAFKLNVEDIKEVNSVKYLGHIICSDSKQGWVQLHKIISITITLCGTKYIQHLLIMYFCTFC